MTSKHIDRKRGARWRRALFAAGAVCAALAPSSVFAARLRQTPQWDAPGRFGSKGDNRGATQIAQAEPVASGDGARAVGVLDSIAHWQNCFSRSQTQDVDAALAACDLVANEPGLFPSTRTRVERRRAAIQEFKSQKRQQDGDARN